MKRNVTIYRDGHKCCFLFYGFCFFLSQIALKVIMVRTVNKNVHVVNMGRVTLRLEIVSATLVSLTQKYMVFVLISANVSISAHPALF